MAHTQLSPDEEPKFQSWYRGWAQRAGIDPDPDNPQHKYDYRGAYVAGDEPAIDSEDGRYHWDSRFKDDDHPNRFIVQNGRTVDTKNDMSVETGGFLASALKPREQSNVGAPTARTRGMSPEEQERIVSLSKTLLDQMGLLKGQEDVGPAPVSPQQRLAEENKGKGFLKRKSRGGIPAWGYIAAGLADLISQKQDEDYDPDTERPDTGPGPLSMLAGMDQERAAGADKQYGEASKRYDAKVAAATETARGNRASANAILPTIIASVTKDKDEAAAKAPPALATWENIQQQPWYTALPDAEKIRVRDGILGVPASKPEKTPKDVEADAANRRRGEYGVDKEFGVGKFAPPKDANDENAFAVKQFTTYTTKPGLYTNEDARRGVPRVLTPGEAQARVDQDMTSYRAIRQKYPKIAPNAQSVADDEEGDSDQIDLSSLDPELADMARRDPRILEAIKSMQHAPPGSSMSVPPLGPYQPQGGMQVPGADFAPPQQPQGFLSGAMQATPPMAGAPPMGPGGMPAAAPPPPMPQGPGGAPDPMMLIQGYKNFIRQNPGQREEALRQFRQKWGFNPEGLEQSAAQVR